MQTVRKFTSVMMAALALVILATPVMAMEFEDAAGYDNESHFLYSLYDLLMNKGLDGPLGAAIGIALLGWGIFNLTQNRIAQGMIPLLVTGLIWQLDTIARFLGAVV
jgi:hypothetical protein